MKKVALLFGGNSFEHLVSCKSAKTILENIDYGKYEVTRIGISKNNSWYEWMGPLDHLIDGGWIEDLIIKIENPIVYLKKFDVVFPVIHGNDGEDGKLQGFLELFGIPFVGCDHMVSAVGYDKECSKYLFDALEIPQVPYFTIGKEKWKMKDLLKELSFPMIVKPARCGSSIGITKVENQKELKQAIMIAKKYDEKVIVEKFIQGQELECAVLGGTRILVSRVGEIKSCHDFYDYEAKYDSPSITKIPADLDDVISTQIQSYSKKLFQTLGMKGLCRMDFFYDSEHEKIYLNEINTVPGFTEISMYPQLIIDLGYSLTEVITMLLSSV